MKPVVIIAAALLAMTLPACSKSTADQTVSTPIAVKIGKAQPIEDHEVVGRPDPLIVGRALADSGMLVGGMGAIYEVSDQRTRRRRGRVVYGRTYARTGRGGERG